VLFSRPAGVFEAGKHSRPAGAFASRKSSFRTSAGRQVSHRCFRVGAIFEVGAGVFFGPARRPAEAGRLGAHFRCRPKPISGPRGSATACSLYLALGFPSRSLPRRESILLSPFRRRRPESCRPDPPHHSDAGPASLPAENSLCWSLGLFVNAAPLTTTVPQLLPGNTLLNTPQARDRGHVLQERDANKA
jgi:hypothetical protein